MDIRFGDHASFHRAAAGMVGGSLLVGLALHPLTSIAPLLGGVAGIALGAAWAYGYTKTRIVMALIALVPLIALAKMGWTTNPIPPVCYIIAASVLALGLAAGGPRGVRGALGVGLSALVGLAAMWCALRITGARETATWPSWIADGAGAAAMGIVGILAMVPRHLRVAVDPVQTAVRRLPVNLDAEVKGLCDRAVTIWNQAKSELADEGGQRLVRDGVLKTLEVAVKSSEVRVAGATDAELASRMAELDKKIAATSDTEAKTQYQAARSALDDQQRYREHIAKNRERLVARMHNHVAALEKFQLAATGLEAARAATASSTAVKQLEELSQDVAASGEALAEIEIGDTATALPPASN